MFPHLNTLYRFQANQSYLLLINNIVERGVKANILINIVCLSEKQQVPSL